MPTALLVSTALYRIGAARMPAALKAAGFRVHVVCPKNSLLQLSDFLDGGRVYSEQLSSSDLVSVTATAAAEINADIIIACDEAAAHALADDARSPERWQDCRIKELHRGLGMIRTWFGAWPNWEVRRSDCVDAAAAAGIRTPRQITIDVGRTSGADLAVLGTPVIAKLDNSSAGRGVIKANSPNEALEQITALQESRPSPPAGCRTVAQDFISGRSASVSFSALSGQMLEAFSYSVVHHEPEPFGPASVIEVIDQPGLLEMASQMVKLAEYSGFGGIDAILPDDGGAPVFLEFNARPTQTTHLGQTIGADLCRAMACALNSQPYENSGQRRKQVSIALFPSEWVRDRNSRYLSESYHDVPWNERRLTSTIMVVTPELHPG